MKNRLFGVLRRARSVCAPKNAGKRIFAAFLAVCVSVSALTVSVVALPEGGGNISPHPSATVPLPSGGGMVAGFVANWLINIGGQALSSWYDEQNDKNIIRNIQVMSDIDSISVSYNKDEGKYYFSANPELTGEALECATYLAGELETNVNRHVILGSTTILDNPDTVSISPELYSYLKKVSYDALNSYYIQNSDRFKAEHSANSIQSVRDLENALGNTFPRYDFDFVGPIPTLSMTTPNVDRISSLTMDGFTFTPAASFTPGQTAFTRSQTEYIASFASRYVSSAGDYIRLNAEHDPLYAFNYYFLTDDGNLYFSAYSSYNANGKIPGNSFPLNTSTFYDVSGKMITGKEANAIKSRITSVGAVLNTGNQIQNAIPVGVKGTLTDEDFLTSSGGEEVSMGIPRSDIENIIGGAIGAGLIAADAPLTIGADGKITAADGIPVDKLGQILDAIQSGNLNLDSMAEYLSLISTLVANGNLTATEQQKILENVNTNIKATAKDISEIKDILKEWADADELEENLDFDLPDVTIIDKFPFSLPFDVYYVLDLLCTEPKKPIFTIPIKTTLKAGNFSYTVDKTITLDLTTFKIGNVDMVQAVINTGVTIAFVFALIAGTRKFIWK